MILITGANGQLGQDFQKLFNQLNVEYLATHRVASNGCQALDIRDRRAVESIVRDNKIKLIINCAAYNHVDNAEVEKEQAFELNRDVPQHLAWIAQEYEAVLVTYSSDFVFDGLKGSPYVEEDQPHPLSTYGESKYQGEQAVLTTYDRVFVIRTSWVYGLGNHNFSKSVLNWSKTNNELKIVADQISVPTYTNDLAAYSWDLIQTDQYGLYHLTNAGEASKFEQARYILNKVGWSGNLLEGKTEEFNLPARRAAYSKLSSVKAEQLIGREMPHWQDALDRFLEEMKEAGELV